MKKTRFFERLARAQKKNGSYLCVGLDPDLGRLPAPFKKRNGTDVARFNRAIVEATADIACAYKPNWAFYEAMGLAGLRALEKTLEVIPSDIPVIADAKRGDIGNTARQYARSLFETWGVGAATVSPYMGADTLEPFTEYADRAVYVLCLTSNPGAADFETPRRLYLDVARKMAEIDRHGNIGLVVGATQSRRIAAVRRAAPELPFLLPGIGSQGGSAQAAMKGAWSARGGAILVNASRSILYASAGADFAEAARQAAIAARDELNAAAPNGS